LLTKVFLAIFASFAVKRATSWFVDSSWMVVNHQSLEELFREMQELHC